MTGIASGITARSKDISRKGEGIGCISMIRKMGKISGRQRIEDDKL